MSCLRNVRLQWPLTLAQQNLVRSSLRQSGATVFVLFLLFNTSCCATEINNCWSHSALPYIFERAQIQSHTFTKTTFYRAFQMKTFFKVTASKAFWGCYTTAYWMEQCLDTCTAWQTDRMDVTSLCLIPWLCPSKIHLTHQIHLSRRWQSKGEYQAVLMFSWYHCIPK